MTGINRLTRRQVELAKGLARTSKVVRELMRQMARWALQRGLLDRYPLVA